MNKIEILRDRMVFLCNSLCHMLTTASWTVFLDDGPIDGLCGYEITLYRGEEIINRFSMKIEKELPHNKYLLSCEDIFSNKDNFIFSLEYTSKEYVPLHEWISDKANCEIPVA